MTKCVRVAMVAVGAVLGGTLALPSGGEAQRARQGLLSLDGARIFYEVIGSGEPIVVVHGGPGLDHNYLQPGLDGLATRNTLIYYDQRGTGRSSATLDERGINLDRFVDDIDALRQALGYERISVLGHSFGALLAIEYVARYPDDARALILMSPVEPGSRFREVTEERRRARLTLSDSARLADLRASEGFAARDAGTLSEVYRTVYRLTMRDPDLLEELSLDLSQSTAKNGQDVARLLGGSIGAIDWWDRLPEIDVPTLVLHGRHDIPPVEMSLQLAETFPVGTFEVLESGHFPYVEDPEGLLAAISGFFASLPR